MNLSNIIKHFKIDLNIIKKDYAAEPYIGEEEFEHYQNGELDKEHGPPPHFHYQNCSDRYLLKDADEANYCAPQRSEEIVPIYLEDAKRNEKCFIVGCLIKKGDISVNEPVTTIDGRELRVKPKVWDELDLVLDYDELFFRDSQQDDVTLKGKIGSYEFFTGLAVGIYGTLRDNYEFYVDNIIHPLLPEYVDRPLLEEDVYIIILSGFNFFKACPLVLRQLNHFCDVLNSEKYYNKIARMVIAGNNSDTVCFCEDCQGDRLKDIGFHDDTLALRTANALKRLFPHIDIDVMPGDTDPVSATFPQQPLHKALFESYKIPTEKKLIKDEEIIDRMKNRKRKRGRDESDNEVEIIEVGVAAVNQERTVVPMMNAQPINDQIPKDIIQEADDIYIPADFDDDIPEVVGGTGIPSPSPSEKKYSAIFSQETIVLTDDSVKVKGNEAKQKYFREAYNEEYGIAVDNWLLDRVGRNPSFQRQITPVTNPYCFKVMGVEIHGTSGQNVDSLRKVTQKENLPLDFLNGFLKSGHLFPTAPDYLDLLPYTCDNGKDPLALDQMPHIFFAGNQNEFATKLIDYGNNRKVRLIYIPKYNETQTMIAVNLRTLQTSQIIPRHRI
uniref:DNA polymerase alpha/delta/epsilon subunit B domain-containing protein n=1 Tax=Panagrolaimus sp. ES5 TaxID=591445 RepID=A0AC34FJL4_9BILA